MHPVIILTFCLFFLSACGSEAPPHAEEISTYTNDLDISDSDFKDLKETNKDCIKRTSLIQNIHHSDFNAAINSHAPLFNTLLTCGLILDKTRSCDFNTLDFLVESQPLTTNKIQQRVIATKPWMLHNFESLLKKMPSDLLPLFRSITAIIIHPAVDFAYFSPVTGALYIDPSRIAIQTREIEDTQASNEQLNFCTKPAVGSFHYYSRYLLGSQTAFSEQQTSSDAWRIVPDYSNNKLPQDDQAAYALASILFHELAHANDFFHPDNIQSRNRYSTPAEWLTQQDLALTDTVLSHTPSTLLTAAAKTHFERQAPTDFLASMPIDALALAFHQHPMNDLYGHLSSLEATAILFEEWAMKAFFNLDREVAWITPKDAGEQGCQNVTFHHPDINRVLAPERLANALNIARAISIDTEAFTYTPAQQFYGCALDQAHP